MPDYSEGKIYKIVNTENDKVYIGSTTQLLCNRMSLHRYDANHRVSPSRKLYKSMRFHGVEKFKIKLVKDYPCHTKEQLLAKEFQTIKKYSSKGVILYNTMTENGMHSTDTKQRMSERTRGSGNSQYGKVGTSSARFNRGSVCSTIGNKAAWIFSWRENGKQRKKSFGIQKFGDEEAKRLAEEYRDKIYPIE